MTDNNHELTIVRVFDAPKELVFKAWTDPELLTKWWGPEGVTTPVCKMDARPGGEIDIVMLAGEELGDLKGSEWPMKGTVKEVVPDEKLVYESSAIMDSKPIMDTTSTVTFDDEDGKTKLTLHVQVTRVTPEAEGPLSGMQMGWNQSIDKLGRFVEQLQA